MTQSLIFSSTRFVINTVSKRQKMAVTIVGNQLEPTVSGHFYSIFASTRAIVILGYGSNQQGII